MSALSSQEKLKKVAAHCGLAMPKVMEVSEETSSTSATPEQ